MSAASDESPASLTTLRSECELCGEWSPFTGRTETRDGRTYVVTRCPRGHGEFTTWRRDREALVAAYARARAQLRDPAAFDRAYAELLGGDASAIAAIAARPPAELPLLSVEDIALPEDAAANWCRLLLDYQGWRPLPTRATRLEEAIATAVALDAPTCVALVIGRASPDELRAAIDQVHRRFPDHDPGVLLPLLPILEGHTS